MDILQFEQSGLVITNSEGKTLAVDIASYTPLEKLKGISVDAMIISHIHGDHFSISHIKALEPKKLYVGSECAEALEKEFLSCEVIVIHAGEHIHIDGVQVNVFEVDHGPNVPKKPRENFGFLFTHETDSIYFPGDMFYPSGIEVADLEVKTVLLPVGEFYTFGPEEAVLFAQRFKKVERFLPMHYENNPSAREAFCVIASQHQLPIE